MTLLEEPQQQQSDVMFMSQNPMSQDNNQPSYKELRKKYSETLMAKYDDLTSLIEGDIEAGSVEFHKAYLKFNRQVYLVEETYLKEKLTFKRALTLCKSLLKLCGVQNVND